MAATTAPDMLKEFEPKDVTVRVLDALFRVIPGTPAFVFYPTVDAALPLVAPSANLATAMTYMGEPGSLRALKVANAIDTGDVGLTIYTGLRSAMKFFSGDRKAAAETDPQQGADAALKAAAIAYMTYSLFPGSMSEKVQALRATDAGQRLLAYYAAVEVAMPFADDVMTSTGGAVSTLVAKYGGKNLSRLESAAGLGASKESEGVLKELLGTLDGIVKSVSSHTGTIAGALTKVMPKALAATDKVAGAVATGADALPVYRILGAQLVTEAALRRAQG
jgi:hypothetical protein